MRSFDEKNFESMRNCLCQEIFLNYSSFRNEVPTTYTSTEYCEKRRESLAPLITQHNLNNLIIKINDNNLSANITCNFTIYRFLSEYNGDKSEFFHSYGQYEFEVKFHEKKWKISSIIQKIIMNEGNKNIHSGVKV